MYVTKEQIRQARRVNLADYLLRENPADVKIVGSSLCLKTNPSLYVKKSVPGYHDFATGEHGNSIDFLTRHLNCSFTEAVNALCRFDGFPQSKTTMARAPFRLPKRAQPPFDRVVTYLTGRGIPPETVMFLIQENLLYQDTPHGNAVFVSPNEDYCEIRGTGSRPFHGCRKRKSDRFWYLLTDPQPETTFVCEAAIDAVSLMLIRKAQGKTDPAAYVSIGGATNQQTIDRLKIKKRVLLAVDNDKAGDDCRCRNPDLPVLIPAGKDWNEDLCGMMEKKGDENTMIMDALSATQMKDVAQASERIAEFARDADSLHNDLLEKLMILQNNSRYLDLRLGSFATLLKSVGDLSLSLKSSLDDLENSPTGTTLDGKLSIPNWSTLVAVTQCRATSIHREAISRYRDSVEKTVESVMETLSLISGILEEAELESDDLDELLARIESNLITA